MSPVAWAIVACAVALAYIVTARIAVRHVQRRNVPGLPRDEEPLS